MTLDTVSNQSNAINAHITWEFGPLRCAIARPVSMIGMDRNLFANYCRPYLSTRTRVLEIGQGRRAPGTILDALRSGQRVDTGCTAPASGLCLEEVFFSRAELDRRVADLRSSLDPADG